MYYFTASQILWDEAKVNFGNLRWVNTLFILDFYARSVGCIFYISWKVSVFNLSPFSQ